MGQTFTSKLFLGASASNASVESGNALPVGGNPGDLFLLDTAGVGSLHIYNGSAWVQANTGGGAAGAAGEVQYSDGSGGFNASANLTYNGTQLIVATGGSNIDIGQGLITGGPNLTVETMPGGTLTLGTAGETVDIIGLNILVNGQPGNSGDVLASNGPGVAPTWTTPAAPGITDLTGDVTATGPGSAAATVVAIQGTAVSAAAPALNQVLKYDGAQWAPATDAAASPAAPVDSIQYNNAGSFGGLTLTDGQILIGVSGGTPSAATITGGGGIDVTSAAGAITLGSTAGGDLSGALDTASLSAAGINNANNLGLTALTVAAVAPNPVQAATIPAFRATGAYPVIAPAGAAFVLPVPAAPATSGRQITIVNSTGAPLSIFGVAAGTFRTMSADGGSTWVWDAAPSAGAPRWFCTSNV